MKYTANYTANNGTHLAQDISDTNKARIIKTIYNIANGNRHAGSQCNWYVHDSNGYCVAAGYTLACGLRYRIKGILLRYYDVF